jgi:hypothetical protein
MTSTMAYDVKLGIMSPDDKKHKKRWIHNFDFVRTPRIETAQIRAPAPVDLIDKYDEPPPHSLCSWK